MKNAFVLLCCIFLFVQCKPAKTIQPNGNYDTLGIHWSTIEGTNITYYFQDFSIQSGYATQYVNYHEYAYTELNGIFNATLPQKLRFFIWSDATLAAQKLNQQLGFTDPYHCTCYVRGDQSIGHEMTHVLSYWAWGRTPIARTRFVNEGVAVAFDLNNYNRIEVAKSAVSGQGINSITDLWSGSYQNGPEQVFYPIAGAFMDYLYKQNQPARFDSLIKNQTIESAQNIYGKDQLDKIISDFDKLIGL